MATSDGVLPYFLAGGGEMGARIRAHDWAATTLGPPEDWPQSLRSALSICLLSSVPTAIYWGPELRLIYNDAWVPIPAERHPLAFGQPGREVWSDIWDVVGEHFDQVWTTGQGFSTYDQMLPMVRNGVPQETYWHYSLTPIRGEDGSVEGILNQGYETTARIMAERRSLAERERLRRMFDQAPGFMAMLQGEDHVFELANRAYLDLVGRADIVGKPVRAVLPEVEGQGYFELLDKVYESGEAFVGTAVAVDLRRNDAIERRFVDLVYQPITDEQGQITGIFVEGSDVTERVRAEADLRELNETLEQRIAEALAERKLFAELLETTSAFVQILDQDFRFLAVNAASAEECQRVLGFTPSAGDNLLELLRRDAPDNFEAVEALWARSLAGETFTQVAELGDPRHGRRWYDMKFAPVRSFEGDVIGASLIGYDVTGRIEEQRKLADAEAARRDADALYRAYFENTAEALFIITRLEDGGFSIEELNPAHELLTGLRTEEIRGKPLDQQLPADFVAEAAGNYQRAVDAGHPISYREVITLPAGTRHWDTILVPVSAADGRVCKIIGSARDVTARVLAEEQLRQSQKLEAMGSLTGGVSHDFNNLLSPIIGTLDLLQRRGVGSERESRLIDGALQSAERARLLVQRLLAFARRQPLQTVSVAVGDLVNGMADLIRSTTGPQIKVVVDVAEDLPSAVADPNQLEMALLNLSVNARDAMPDGGTLRISAVGETIGLGHPTKLEPAPYVRLSVADTGVGMDGETLKRAVEPFYSTKGVGKGTGLGLSMAHGLAAQLGGALTIASEPGLGTNIELWLPVGGTPVITQGSSAEAIVRPDGKGTVLLVDDEDIVRASTADMLVDLGFDVVEARSAEEALAWVSDGLTPDLIVTDHLMPGRSGSDLALEVRGRWPDLPVLLVSGYAEVDGVAPDLMRLVKPFRQADLAAHIADLAREQEDVVVTPAERGRASPLADIG